MSSASYHDLTYNSPNPLRRWAHRTRFAKSVQAIDPTDGARVLDFGCGDGLFLNQLKRSSNVQLRLTGYEPYMEGLDNNEVPILNDWEDVKSLVAEQGKFDIVTSFEVFEHFSPDNQLAALSKIREVLATGGSLVISVPVEIGVPGLVKNVIRKIEQKNKNPIYSVRNIAKSIVGSPMPEIRDEDGYLPHMGFYFKDLEDVFKKHFEITKKFYSPLGMLGFNANSQVFYRLRPIETTESRP